MVFGRRKRKLDPFIDVDRIFDYIEEITRRSLDITRSLVDRFYSREYDMFKEPLLDIIDEGDRYIIEIDLPGVSREDIKIRVANEHLDIVAKRKLERREEDEGFIKMERSFLGYARRIALPPDADTKNIKAKYQNGVLTIIIPKSGSEKSDNYIPVE